MISTFPKIRAEHERRVNRTCAIACMRVSVVLALIIALGLTGVLQISDCIAKCKARIAVDRAFAELVERDPAAAVRVVRSSFMI